MSEVHGSPAEFNFPELDPALTLEEQARLGLLDAQDVFLRSAVRIASHQTESTAQLRIAGDNMYLHLRATMGYMTKRHTSFVPVEAAAALLARLDEGQVGYYQSVRPTEPRVRPLPENKAVEEISRVVGSMSLNTQDATLRLYARQTRFNVRYLFGFVV